MKRADYGVDSPAVVVSELVLALLVLSGVFLFPRPIGWRLLELLAAAGLFASAGSMLHYSRSGKLGVRDIILDSIAWRGDETVLDAGCGGGLLLIGAAKRAPRGRAMGVDVWNRGALSGNGPPAVIENAVVEGVVSRVEVRSGDVRKLPFDDASFDVVVSNFVIHEVNNAAERERVVSEMVRVLKPGGRIALVDFIFTGECVATLYRYGIGDARRKRIGGLASWIGTILMLGTFQMCLVTGSKNG
jgi:SAM-dependent methyltransferase